jgi:hypothetical protein
MTHMANHMDVNAIVDGSLDPAVRNTAQAGTALNLKRYFARDLTIRQWFSPEAENPYWIGETTEFKTAWHPIGW